jgi:cytochrome c oxidase subunit 2
MRSTPKHINTAFIAAGTSMIFVLLAVSFIGVGPSETLAQGTNATNATGASGGAGGAAVTVVMPLGSSAATAGKGYDPDPVTVPAGGTVIWKNDDNALHTATSGNAATATPDGKFDTGYITAKQSSKPITMPTQSGEIPYFCTLHPFLTGTVTVQ